MKKILFLISTIFLIGCTTLSPPGGQTSKAGYVGDYDSADFVEIVVSVPTGIHENHYQNLHVSFSALINPREATVKSSYKVSNIVQRFYVRLSSTIVEEILDYGRISVQDLAPLRDKLVNKAQSEFDQMFSKWSHSDEFDVEIVMTSIFLTDGNVGR